MAMEFGLTPDGKWTIDTEGLAAAVGDAGFTTVGIGVPKADADADASLRAHGLRCHEILALLMSADEQATLGQLDRIVAAAETLRAEWVLTTFMSPLEAMTTSLVHRCASRINEVGAKMAVEFSPLGGIPSLAAGLDVVEAAGAHQAGVMIDTWHYLRGPSTWEQLETVPLDRIAYVQFNDALPPLAGDGMSAKETMHFRTMPGRGVFDLHRFADTLLDRGWTGLVDVEVLSGELRDLPVSEFARQAYDTTAPYWLR